MTDHRSLITDFFSTGKKPATQTLNSIGVNP